MIHIVPCNCQILSFLAIAQELVKQQPQKFDILISGGPSNLHPRVLTELAEELLGCQCWLSIELGTARKSHRKRRKLMLDQYFKMPIIIDPGQDNGISVLFNKEVEDGNIVNRINMTF